MCFDVCSSSSWEVASPISINASMTYVIVRMRYARRNDLFGQACRTVESTHPFIHPFIHSFVQECTFTSVAYVPYQACMQCRHFIGFQISLSGWEENLRNDVQVLETLQYAIHNYHKKGTKCPRQGFRRILLGHVTWEYHQYTALVCTYT